jgi:hypothetical protein
MRTAIKSLLVVVLTASLAAAATPDEAAVTTRSQAELLSDSPLTLTLDLSASLLSADPLPSSFALTQTRRFLLPELPPETLELAFALSETLDFVLAADLDSPLARLDSVDDETYFSVGFHHAVAPWLTVFVEDFMSASTVVGSDRDYELDPVPSLSWDGHQVSLGGAVAITEHVSVRAEVVAYVLSPSDRSDGLGARGAVTVRF